MASYQAIAAVSTALAGLLTDARPPELSGATIAPLQLADFQKPKTFEDGISIVLYRVAVSGMPRTLSARPDAEGRRKLPSLPVDLYYLFTPWGRTVAMQQRLLGWLVRALEDANPFNASMLNHYGGPEHIFDESETVTLIPDTLALQDLTNLWDVLKPNQQVSVAYLARMVHIDSLRPPEGGGIVQTRDFEYAQAST